MSSNSPPKTVSLDPEDTGRQETGKQFHLTFKFDISLMFFFYLAVVQRRQRQPWNMYTTPVQQRRPLPSTRPDNNAKRGFVCLLSNIISLHT